MNKYIKLNNIQRFAIETHFNGGEILKNIYFNGNDLEAVYFNGNLVFKKADPWYIIDYNLTTDGSGD